MNTYIKLTDEYGTTQNGMRWDIGVTNRATGEGNELCTDGVLHVYDTPEQAVFMRFAHCSSYTRAWEVESEDEGISDGTKRGIKSCTVIREIELPELTIEQRVEIAIRVSLLVYSEVWYVEWAKRWLSGEDRTAKAAFAEARAAYGYAAFAAYYAAQAAYTFREANADHAATSEATYSAGVSNAAAYAAAYAYEPIDLQSIIREVLE